MENFGKLMTVVLMMIISPIVNGFVFTKLWGWFIVTTFNMQPLRVVESIGVILLINFIRVKRSKKDEPNKFWVEFTESVIFVFLMAGLALFTGWIVTLFM